MRSWNWMRQLLRYKEADINDADGICKRYKETDINDADGVCKRYKEADINGADGVCKRMYKQIGDGIR